MSQLSEEHLLPPDEMAAAEEDTARLQQARQDRIDQLSSTEWLDTASYNGDPLIMLSANNIPNLCDQYLYPIQEDTPRFNSEQLLAKHLSKSQHYVHAQYALVVAEFFSASRLATTADYHSLAHGRFAKELLRYGKCLIVENDPAVAAVEEVLASSTGPSLRSSSFCAVHGWCSHTLPECSKVTNNHFQRLPDKIKGFRAAEMLKYAHPLAVLTTQRPQVAAARAAVVQAQQKPSAPTVDAAAPAVHAATTNKRKGVPSVAAPPVKQHRALCSSSRGPASAPATQALVVPAAVPAAPAAAAPVAAVSTHSASSLQATNVDGLPGQAMFFTETVFRHSTQLVDRVLEDKEKQLIEIQAELKEVKEQLRVACTHRDKYRIERDSARAFLQEANESAAFYRRQVVEADNRAAAQRSPNYADSNV